MKLTSSPVRRLSLSSIALCLALTGCGHPQHPAAPPPVAVGIVTLQPHPVQLQAELPGRTTVYEVSDVRPQVNGIIKSRLFVEGSQVKAGQVLYQIDPAPYQAAFDKARADLASTEATVASAALKDQRYAELRQIEGVSKQDADDANAAHRQAVATVELKKAALETARINLGYTQVRAPISGRIGSSAITPGALVTADQTTALATIRTLDPIYVDVTQSSAQLLQLRRAMSAGDLHAGSTRVLLKLEDGSQYPLAGTLKFQEVAVDEATGTVTLRAQFPNPNGVLLPGMYVRAVVSEGVSPNAILAPQQGVSRDDRGNATALVVGADNKVEQRTLTVPRTVGNDWLVTQGLAAGERLIVEGINKVHPGDAVAPVTVTLAADSGAASGPPQAAGAMAAGAAAAATASGAGAH